MTVKCYVSVQVKYLLDTLFKQNESVSSTLLPLSITTRRQKDYVSRNAISFWLRGAISEDYRTFGKGDCIVVKITNMVCRALELLCTSGESLLFIRFCGKVRGYPSPQSPLFI